jgi:hypothetical protein
VTVAPSFGFEILTVLVGLVAPVTPNTSFLNLILSGETVRPFEAAMTTDADAMMVKSAMGTIIAPAIA